MKVTFNCIEDQWYRQFLLLTEPGEKVHSPFIYGGILIARTKVLARS